MNTLAKMQELRAAGYSVKIIHKRQMASDIYMSLPRGGTTYVEVVAADGTGSTGIARCSQRDNYCKRIGRDIAFGRALKSLGMV